MSKKRRVGRPDKTERDIQIWYSYYYLHKPIWELEKEYGIGKPAIKKALQKVSREFVNIPNKIVLRGSIYAIQERLKRLTALLEREMKKKEPSIRNIKELNSEIRNDQIELDKLQNLYLERYSVEVEGGGSVKEILSILAKKK
ncbi:MAG: hypothetical protein ACTSR2_01870 [Candidatus Hodarchaeales archaeon]